MHDKSTMPSEPPPEGMVWGWDDDTLDQPGWWRAVRCATCMDSRWLRNLQTRALDPCPDCPDDSPALQRGRLTSLAFARAGLYDLHAQRWETFDPGLQPGGPAQQAAAAALRAATEWCHDEGPAQLLLVGGSGVGKTHLMEGAVCRLVQRSESCRYVLWTDFAHEVAGNFDERHVFLTGLRDVKRLLVDDIGSVREGPAGAPSNALQDLLLHRFDSYKPTLVSGNLAREDNEGQAAYVGRVFGPRLADRMRDGNRVRIASLWRCSSLRGTGV